MNNAELSDKLRFIDTEEYTAELYDEERIEKLEQNILKLQNIQQLKDIRDELKLVRADMLLTNVDMTYLELTIEGIQNTIRDLEEK